MRVLGIDPGLRNTGFGVIEIIKNIPHYITSGVIFTETAGSLPSRLKTIMIGLDGIITDTKPKIVSIEKVFVNINPQSTLLLGQARGAAICACVQKDLEVFEYSALQIKKAVIGYGHAEKQQVAKMVCRLLNLNREPQSDAADALAIALTHINQMKHSKIFI